MVDQYGRWYPDYPGQQPYQDPAYLRLIGQPVPANAQKQPQAMSYPTIHADIVQTDDQGVIERWGVSQDKPQMFINLAETQITVKSVEGNGVVLSFYDKRPPAPPAPAFDPAAYVRRDELATLVADAVASQGANHKEAAV